MKYRNGKDGEPLEYENDTEAGLVQGIDALLEDAKVAEPKELRVTNLDIRVLLGKLGMKKITECVHEDVPVDWVPVGCVALFAVVVALDSR